MNSKPTFRKISGIVFIGLFLAGLGTLQGLGVKDARGAVEEVVNFVGVDSMMLFPSKETVKGEADYNGHRYHYTGARTSQPALTILQSYKSAFENSGRPVALQHEFQPNGGFIGAYDGETFMLVTAHDDALNGDNGVFMLWADKPARQYEIDPLLLEAIRERKEELHAAHPDLFSKSELELIQAAGHGAPSEAIQALDVRYRGFLQSDPQMLSLLQAAHQEMQLQRTGEEAGGSDLADVPRMPDSVRLRNLAMFDGGNRVVSYEINGNSERAVQFYRREMERHGWKEEKAFSLGYRGHGPATLYYQKDDAFCSILITEMKTTGSVRIGITRVDKS